METILERYERYAYAEKMLTAPEIETQVYAFTYTQFFVYNM